MNRPNSDLVEALSEADAGCWIEEGEAFEEMLACIELLRETFAGRPGRWAKRAACRGMDINIFFPGRGGKTAEAEAVCAKCPVRAQCAAHALSLPPGTVGIFAGQSTIARDAERRNLEAA